MTKTQMMRYKAELQTKRQELVCEFCARTGELAVPESGHDAIDQLQSMSQRDEAALALQRLSRTLSDVDAALRAMSEGLYGDCIECGEAISLKRLETIPWASRCIRCQEVLEGPKARKLPAAEPTAAVTIAVARMHTAEMEAARDLRPREPAAANAGSFGD